MAEEIEQEEVEDTELSSPDDSSFSPGEEHGVGESGTEATEANRPSWQASLEEAGFQSFDDIDNAVRALVEANKQRDEQINYYADQLKFYQQQARQTEQPTAQPQQAPSKSEVDPLSELTTDWTDPSWASKYITIDEDGNRVISPDTDDETRQKIQKIDKSLRRWQEMINDPLQFADVIDKRVERMIQEKFEDSYQQKQTAASEQGYVSNFVTENADWLYAKDPASGQFIMDPLTNQHVYSQAGAKFQSQMDRLADSGVTSIVRQIEIAKEIMRSTQATGSSQTVGNQVSAQEIAAQKRNQMRGASNNRSRNQRAFNGVSTEPASEPTGKNTMSWGELTLAARQQGE